MHWDISRVARLAHSTLLSLSRQAPRALQNFSWVMRGLALSVKDRHSVGVLAA